MALRDIGMLGLRATVGGYVAAHGAQKLFGAFGGYGLEGTGSFMKSLGLAPGKQMAGLAGGSELVGGVLTALGLGGPIGPAAIASTMGVAAGTAHRGKGPFAEGGGPELPITNVAAVMAIAAAGPGSLSLDRVLGTKTPRWLTTTVLAGSAAMAATLVARATRASSSAADETTTPGGGNPEPKDSPAIDSSSTIDLTAEQQTVIPVTPG